jgi:hypothetical protein
MRAGAGRENELTLRKIHGLLKIFRVRLHINE